MLSGTQFTPKGERELKPTLCEPNRRYHKPTPLSQPKRLSQIAAITNQRTQKTMVKSMTQDARVEIKVSLQK